VPPAPLTLTALSGLTYTEKVLRVDAPHLCEALSRDGDIVIWRHDETPGGEGRLAQLVRAPALQAGGRRFESCTAHHFGNSGRQNRGRSSVG
jgi:hypothetical protein